MKGYPVLRDYRHGNRVSPYIKRNENRMPSTVTAAWTRSNIVAIHLERVRLRQVQTTQIGCAVLGSDQTFFRAIQPAGLQAYLASHTMDGDVLAALHLNRLAGGEFEFRDAVELAGPDGRRVKCVTEEEAIQDLQTFLGGFQNLTLMAIDEETVKEVLAILEPSTVKKFQTFQTVLSSLMEEKSGMELDDFYSENCGQMKAFSTAEDVSRYLKEAFIKCSDNDFQRRTKIILANIAAKLKEVTIKEILKEGIQTNQMLTKENSIICIFKEMFQEYMDIAAPVEELKTTFEVISSFKPSVSTSITGRQLSLEIIDSDTEDDEPENQCSEYFEKNVEKEDNMPSHIIEITDDESDSFEHDYEFDEWQTCDCSKETCDGDECRDKEQPALEFENESITMDPIQPGSSAENHSV